MTVIEYIGELFLVVIGILIALRLNNWNEIRKTRIFEKKTLKELLSDLKQNINDIEENITILEKCKQSTEIIINHIENSLPYNDSLDSHFSNLYPYITFSPIQTTYNNLSQTGMNLISNDSLRVDISDLFANQYSSYRVFESTYFVEHHNNYIKPMFMREFETFERESLKPKQYDQFIKNQDYKQIMNYTVSSCTTFIKMQSKLRESAKKLIIDIEKEIGESINSD